MPRFAANLSLMFSEWPFLDRFAAAADLGFSAVELQFPYDYPADAIAKRLQDNRLTLILFNAPAGDFAAGERGFAALAPRAADFRASLAQAKIYAEATGAQRVHVLAGVADPHSREARATYADALRLAVATLEGVDVLIEPLNPRDAPGYFLCDFGAAADLIGEMKLDRLKLQYDIYHRQILHGDVLTSLAALLPIVGHVQIAAVPSRAEPGGGELNDAAVLARLDALGYAGYVGCEYRPAKGTAAGLGWLDPWRQRSEVALRSTWRERM